MDKPVQSAATLSSATESFYPPHRIAKKWFNVRKGEAIWVARSKCPSLIVLPPNYALYVHFSKLLRSIFEEYSDRAESFGLDEARIDISDPRMTFEEGTRIANAIRQRAASDKIISKLGSDMRKPDAVTVIRPGELQEK